MQVRMLGVLLLLGIVVGAQNPVSWKFSSKKTGDRTFEVHFTVTVAKPRHIYSQTTPDGGPVATKISFTKNPLVTIDGIAKEIGKMETKYEEVFGVDVKYFDGGVDFVQVVKVKSNVKTNVTGNVVYMVCNDQQCLPPVTVGFNVALQ